MTCFEVVVFYKLEKLRLNWKSNIQTENNQYCKHFDGKDIMNKVFQDRHIKHQWEKKLDK